MANPYRPKKNGLKKRSPWLYVAIASLLVNVILGLLNYRASRNTDRTKYVGMSLNILGQKHADKKLRQWAVSMMNKEAPVPFSQPPGPSPAINYKMIKVYVPVNAPLPPTAFFEPPVRWQDVPPSVTWGGLVENYVMNRSIAQSNALQLCYLQHLIKAGAINPASAASSYIAEMPHECAVEAGITGESVNGEHAPHVSAHSK
jgi:hypothetical protein